VLDKDRKLPLPIPLTIKYILYDNARVHHEKFEFIDTQTLSSREQNNRRNEYQFLTEQCQSHRVIIVRTLSY